MLIDAEKIQCLSAKCPFSFVVDLIEPATRFTIGSLKEKNSLGVASAGRSLFAKVITNLVLGVSISLIQTYTVSDTYVCLMSLVGCLLFFFQSGCNEAKLNEFHTFFSDVFLFLYFKFVGVPV